jgi:hypothetical protein
MNDAKAIQTTFPAGLAGVVGGDGVACAGVASVKVARKQASPNDRIGAAVIGFNGQGKSHIRQLLAQPDVDLVALCDVDEAVWPVGLKIVEDAGRPKPKTYQDIRKLLEDKDVDVVTIATPNHWHALAAIWAMMAGKDVYVEKPSSHNVWEGRRTVDIARQLGRICQVGTQIRSSEGIRQAIQYLHEGKLGKITLARGLCYKRRDSIGKVPGPQEPPATVDYDVWLGPAHRRNRCCASGSITTGTGSGTTATATWATRACTRWTSPAGG